VPAPIRVILRCVAAHSPPGDAPQHDGDLPVRLRQLEVRTGVGLTTGSSLHRGILGDGTPVLVKRAEGIADPREASEQLRREAELLGLVARAGAGPRPLALLDHPAAPALVLEDRPGELLGVARLPTRECLEIGADLAAALAELHAARLVCRDLRPANVLAGRAAAGAPMAACLVDLSRAAREGTHLLAEAGDDLAYLAPERTGRIGREVDGRADLYSLGVLLYQLLTGSLPFSATDVLGWIHCHVARRPRPPAEVGPVPRAVSDVVMRLLAKLPDDRYQGAPGVRADLEECLRLDRGGGDRPFTVGAHDLSGRFQLPGRFYGRGPELEALLQACRRAAEPGAPALVLVEGPSGIGKTALVEELGRRLVGERFQLGVGRFERERRGSPQATWGAALGGLVQQLLSSSEEEVARWRAALGQALGSQGRLVTDLVPELELLVGPQPPVPALPPQEAQRRFERTWARFLGALAGPGHPLVLFLDDLQWADAEALSLLEYVACDPGTRHLLLVGACRDGELGPEHPLPRTVEALRRQGVAVEAVRPGPFSPEDATDLVADALLCDRGRAGPLAGLVHARTGGNPFFLLQLLSTLVEEGLVAFQRSLGQWSWDLARVQARQDEEGVAALMAEKLRQLPEAARGVLRVAGCLGSGAHLDTLAQVVGRAQEAVERDLSEAVDRGLLRLGKDGTFEFVHDHVQQAAAALLPEEERPGLHHAIGLALLARGGGQAAGDGVFEVVRHLQRAGALLSAEERLRLAGLELEAGRRAWAALAYPSAARHFAEGQALLPPGAWSSHYPLAFALALERARGEWLAGDPARAEEWIAVLLREARTRAERAEAYRVRLDLLTTRNDVEGSVRAALQAGAELWGLELPLHPTPQLLEDALHAALEALQGRAIEAQLDAGEMADPDQRALVALFSSAAPTAYFLDPALHDLMMAEVARRSLLHGNTPHSSHAFACFAVAVGNRLERWSEALRFSAMGCALSDRYGSGSKVGCHFMAGVLQQQVHPPAESARSYRAAWRAAVEGGDANHGCYAGFLLVQMLLAAGEPLAEVAGEARRQLDFTRSVRYLPVEDTILAMARFVEALRGGTRSLGSLEGPGFDGAAFEARITPFYPFLPETYFGFRAFAELLAGDFAAALASCALERPHVRVGPLITNEHHWLVAGLAAAGRWDQLPAAERGPLLDTLRECRERLRGQAGRNPRSLGPGLALVSAEVARAEGRDGEAVHGYDEALSGARREGYLHLEGMAAEAAARFYRGRGAALATAAHLGAARDAYRRWGATAKVEALAAEHPELRAGRAPTVPAEGVLQLDLLAAARASQAISGEVAPDALLETLLRTVVEAAGAQAGWLILGEGADQPVAAQARVEGAGIAVEVAAGSPAGGGELPASVLSYARRTRRPVVLGDAAAPGPYSDDPALRRRGARSVLCLPILRRGELRGLLYLENDLVPSAFTPERLALLELLAAQAAISLELSRHREQLEQLVSRRTAELTGANESLRAANRKLELAHRQLLHSEKMASIGRLAAGVAHEINNPVAYVASNLKALEGDLDELLEATAAGGGGDPSPPGPLARRKELRAELAALLGDTRHGLERVTTIVRALRTYSRVGESAWEVTDLRPGLESTLHLLRNDLERKALVVVEHGETPPVECVPAELDQVFMNVLQNALQAIPGRGTITVRSGLAGDEVWVEVSDTGTGIAPENLSRIFDPFFTTKPAGEGTGLGLSLAYNVIEKHHGHIDVASEPGLGTILRIWLPVRQPGGDRA
jgi:predicted ATPase/signal transduction histidine kinase